MRFLSIVLSVCVLYASGLAQNRDSVSLAQVDSLVSVPGNDTSARVQEFNQDTVMGGRHREEPKDSLVRLIHAKSASIQEVDGVSFRKIMGPDAKFLHNNAFLFCDSALWNMQTNIIDAFGNVRIIQDNTTLTSDQLQYVVEENLAKFRGELVELFDKDGNILRTNHLDYNTRDSVATFFYGGSMKGKDGNLIESYEGNYVVADEIFSFIDNVHIYTDSTFVVSDLVSYDTRKNWVIFYDNTVAWQNDNSMATNSAHLDRNTNTFILEKDNYFDSKTQELWADSVVYSRDSGIVRLYDNIQVLDTAQKMLAFGDYAVYLSDSSKVTLTQAPSVAFYTVNEKGNDTTYLSADTIVYYTKRYCDIDSAIIVQAMERKKLSYMDPVGELEHESALKLAAMKNKSGLVGISAEEADSLRRMSEMQDLYGPGQDMELNNNARRPKASNGKNQVLQLHADSLHSRETVADTAFKASAADSSAVTIPISVKDSSAVMLNDSSMFFPSDSSAVQQLDTTSVAFISAWRNVRIFNPENQAICDTLVYTGIDSIARMYHNPVLWNDTLNQLTADSMQIAFKDGAIYKGNMMSNAFIAAQEDSIHYNQVKGAEMMAFFRDNDIYRFDALGGSSMIVFIREDTLITMMNQKECKILSAHIKERKIQRIKYFESIKNDISPIYNITLENKYLRGFIWRDEERPVSKSEVCDREIKDSERARITGTRFPNFPISRTYFPKERNDILKKRRR